MKRSLDTAFDEGWEGGREQRELEIAKDMLAEGEPVKRVARFTGLDPEVVEKLKRSSASTLKL
jgi:predicted transposase YdaD